MVINSFNPDVADLEKTFLAQSYTLGVTSVEVKNNQLISNNTRIQIGEPGLASTEIVTASTPNANGTTLPISATLFPHSADDPVYLLQFDQVQFYRSTSGVNGPYTILATVNLDVTNEQLETSYNDLTSTTGYYYETAMYNSLSTVTSAFSDPLPAVTGWARNQVGYLIDQIYTEITDLTEDLLGRDEMIGYFNEVNDDLLMQVVRPYNFLLTREVFPRVAGANTIPYPTTEAGLPNMWKFDHMDYNYVNTSTNPVTNDSYTVEVAPSIEYFRNRWTNNSVSLAAPQNVAVIIASGGSLTQNTTYFYEVTAVYSNGAESGPAQEVSVLTTTVNKTADLSWSASNGAASYNIYRGLASGGELYIVNTTNTSYNDNGSASPTTKVPPNVVQDDMVQEIALNESQQQFDYYPASLTSSQAVWYLYFYQYFNQLVSEADVFQTPTPRIYKLYTEYKYYLKRSATNPNYMELSNNYYQQYTMEKMRYKSQDRRDAGTPRRFENEGWVRRSFRR